VKFVMRLLARMVFMVIYWVSRSFTRLTIQPMRARTRKSISPSA
jgi:hypothetical protein